MRETILIGTVWRLLLCGLPAHGESPLIEQEAPEGVHVAMPAPLVLPQLPVSEPQVPLPADCTRDKVDSHPVRVLPDTDFRSKCRALADQINQVFPHCQVTLSPVADKLAVCGIARDASEALQLLRAVRAGALNESAKGADPVGGDPGQQLEHACGSHLINLLRIVGEQKVTLRVILAEVNRAAARGIGLLPGPAGQGQKIIFPTETAPTSPTTWIDHGQVLLAIEVLSSLNLAHSLSEANLLATDGQAILFRAGGQLLVPVAGVQGGQLLPFDVELSVLPVVGKDRDRVRLRTQVQLRTRDLARPTSPRGAAIPPHNERCLTSEVELRLGQTLALGGMLREPGQEGELLLLVTPELPATGATEVQSRPCNFHMDPADLAFYVSKDGAESVRSDPIKRQRCERFEESFIQGPHGYQSGKR